MNVYIGIDGDNIGRKIESIIASENVIELKIFSKNVENRIYEFIEFTKANNGEIIFYGGDSFMCIIEDKNSYKLCKIANNNKFDMTFSVGIGENMKQCMLALKMAKSFGRACSFNFKDVII